MKIRFHDQDFRINKDGSVSWLCKDGAQIVCTELADMVKAESLKNAFRLVYNKTTRTIDRVRTVDGLVADTFEPPIECAQLGGDGGGSAGIAVGGPQS